MSKKYKKFISHMLTLFFAFAGIIGYAVGDEVFAALFIGIWVGLQFEHFVLDRRQYDK